MTQKIEAVSEKTIRNLQLALAEKNNLIEILEQNIKEKTILINSLADDIVELKSILEQRRINVCL